MQQHSARAGVQGADNRAAADKGEGGLLRVLKDRAAEPEGDEQLLVRAQVPQRQGLHQAPLPADRQVLRQVRALQEQQVLRGAAQEGRARVPHRQQEGALRPPGEILHLRGIHRAHVQPLPLRHQERHRTVTSALCRIFRLKTGEVGNLVENAKSIIHHLTAKLIERSKVKMNKLVKISIKTASSINMDIYQSP